MIESTKGTLIVRLLAGGSVNGFPPDLMDRAEVSVEAINAAQSLEDLRIPPSNHLEKLVGKRKGQHSIHISKQWRVCYTWDGEDAFDVEIVDYH